MLLYQNAIHYHDLLVTITSFGNVAKSKYLQKTVKNQPSIHEQIRSRLNSGNAVCHLVRNVFQSPL